MGNVSSTLYQQALDRAAKADALVARMLPVVVAAQAMIHADVSHCKEPFDVFKVFVAYFNPLGRAVQEYESQPRPAGEAAAARELTEQTMTLSQRRELLALSKKPQNTYGRSRARVQRNLVKMGLARFESDDGGLLPESMSSLADICVITDTGKTVAVRLFGAAAG